MPHANDYTVGWICALSTERVAAEAFLDDKHDGPDEVAKHDENDYTLGRIGQHNVVIAVLPEGEYGTASAAGVAKDMLHSFPNVRIGLMVGIGGGAPSAKHDIRLGDIVVSTVRDGKSSVFQYDFGKTIQEQSFQTTGFLNQPPRVLRTAVSGLKAQYESDGHGIEDAINIILEKKTRLRKKYKRPDPASDRLFESSAVHPTTEGASCAAVCSDDPLALIERDDRTEEDDNPAIHYGIIASANQLMKDAILRDKLAAEHGILCFEMEAAGLMNHFPCLVIRGICDYSDSHKNKEWQGYAAMTAAAYATDLLRRIAPNRIEAEGRISDVLESMQEDLHRIGSVSNTIKTGIDAMRSDSHTLSIKRWLSPSDPSTNAANARELQHQGTGTWFLNSPVFAEWKEGSRQHLWLYGLSGCGKTVLSTTILDHLIELNNRPTLNFFFDFSDTRKQSVSDVLRSLIFQLYQRQTKSRGEIDDLFKAHSNGNTQPAIKTLSESLQAMIRVSGGVYIVLDALDECTMRTKLLVWMESLLANREPAHVQVIVTGRPEAEFEQSLRGPLTPGNCVPFDKESVNADICSYIKARIEQSPELQKWASSPSVLKQIEDEVSGKADGMFRWAACQLDSFEACLDREAVENTLNSLPRDLNTTYARMIQNIPQERKKKAIRLLQFLAHSERPLTLSEAVDVMAVRLDNTRSFNAEDRLPRPTDITKYCPSLVLLSKTSKSYRAKHVLQLAHLSIKEYLLHHDAEGFHDEEASINITLTCLSYLGSVRECHYDKITAEFPLARYAANIWMDHARPAEVSEDVVAAAVGFLQNETTFSLWFKLSTQYHNSSDTPKAIYHTCEAGLLEITRILLTTESDINASCGKYGNPLHGAIYGGYKDIVQMLLDWGADINAQYGYFGSALDAAAYGGNKDIVQILLDLGADVNAQGGVYGNALQAATEKGHKEVVQLLLDKGADINARSKGLNNPLQAAAYGGNKDIVQMLLDLGADVNEQGGIFGNALQAAAADGHNEVVHLLLDKGADINASGGQFENALEAAANEGHKEVVQLLLARGAEINPKDGFTNALPAAAVRGHKEIVQLLLDGGADSTAQSDALRAIAFSRHNEIEQMLLDRGAKR